MLKAGSQAERMPLSEVPKGNIVELIGFRDGKETGIGLRGVVRRKYTDLYPVLDLGQKIRLELLFSDGRELVYPGKFQVYDRGSEKDFIDSTPQPMVPGLRSLRVLVR